jgi:hypothetical protein
MSGAEFQGHLPHSQVEERRRERCPPFYQPIATRWGEIFRRLRTFDCREIAFTF